MSVTKVYDYYFYSELVPAGDMPPRLQKMVNIRINKQKIGLRIRLKLVIFSKWAGNKSNYFLT